MAYISIAICHLSNFSTVIMHTCTYIHVYMISYVHMYIRTYVNYFLQVIITKNATVLGKLFYIHRWI